jgi:hypothetical protein
MPVVAVQPEGQLGGALVGGVVAAGIGPFAQAGLDEALGFAIGSRRVGFGAQMLILSRRSALAYRKDLKLTPLSVMTRWTLTPRLRKKRRALNRKRRQDGRFSSGRISE